METLDTGKKWQPLSGNALKIIAAIAMTVDHVGFLFFPLVPAFRLIGRLAMPIFSFMIAEGCRFTRNKTRYFLGVFLLALLCQVVYTVSSGDWFLCVPVSFSMSILLIYALQAWDREHPQWGFAFVLGVAFVYLLTRYVELDYGFWGCMLAVCAALPRKVESKQQDVLSVLMLGICLLPLIAELGSWQSWSLLSLPLLLLYNGQRGKWRMKYFFYIFYPGHLALLQGLQWLLWSL